MSRITTHILDTSAGKPAEGLHVTFEQFTNGSWHQLAKGVSDSDGRIKNLLPIEKKISNGIYRIIFDTRSYYKTKELKCFYPSVTIEFELTDDTHYHVPLLLSPFGYSTYRGS
jgi:hydroxyisourate hydrolase